MRGKQGAVGGKLHQKHVVEGVVALALAQVFKRAGRHGGGADWQLNYRRLSAGDPSRPRHPIRRPRSRRHRTWCGPRRVGRRTGRIYRLSVPAPSLRPLLLALLVLASLVAWTKIERDSAEQVVA